MQGARSMLYDDLMKQWIALRAAALENVPRFLQKRDYFFVSVNLGQAVTTAMLAGMTEWRLGGGDPTPHLAGAVESSRELLEHFDKLDHRDHRCAAMFPLWESAYARFLLGRPVEPALRDACFAPEPERRRPEALKDYWIHVFDTLVFEMISTGAPPAEWDDFVGWLAGRRGTTNYRATLDAYRDVIEAARAADPAAATRALRQAEAKYEKRKGGTVTWGGGALGERMVDFRLAAVIRSAEQRAAAAEFRLDSVHRWRW